MPLISEPSTAESVAVVATAVAFATVLEAGQAYEVSSSTNCWIARAQALTFDDAVFIADNTTETITFGAAHGLTTGDGPFRVSNSGGGPGGVVGRLRRHGTGGGRDCVVGRTGRQDRKRCDRQQQSRSHFRRTHRHSVSPVSMAARRFS